MMEEIKLSKEQRQEIKKTLSHVLKDIQELYNMSNMKKIKIDLYRVWDIEHAGFYLEMEKKSFLIKQIYDFALTKTVANLDNRSDILRTNSDYWYLLNFLNSYEKIREKIISEIERDNRKKARFQDSKTSMLKKLEELNKRYDKEATIDIELPPTVNQHQIEVTRVDGNNVGVINFGERTIKIVTNGDIVLVDKTDNTKEIQRVKSIK